MTLNPKYRTDIDGLRAIAVLVVVAFHAFPNVISGGFIGVDVFFVISGFLISTILYGNLERNQFSLIDFYSRRIRRIFPALILVLVFCFALGWFVLLPDEYKQLGGHMAGGAGFVQNFVLWNEADYFDNLAETKPLLHLWSLGIEEQFYIVWPVLLWIAYRLRVNLLVLTILIGLISFGLNIYGVQDNGTGTFYSPQTRFWELLIGAALAYVTLHKQAPVGKWSILTFSRINPQTWASIRSITGAALLIAGLILINKKSLFPGWWALLPTLGTALILSAGPHAWLNRTILSNKVLTWFGLISYPLYLWHWAFLSFARILEGQTPNEWIRAALVIISIALSALTYYFIEKPIRFGKHLKSKTIILIVLMTIVGGVGYNTYKREGLGFRSIAKGFEALNWKVNTRSSALCFNESLNANLTYCENPKSAIHSQLNIVLIGDSHAGDKYPGLVTTADKISWSILGNQSCPPLLGVDLPYDKSHCQKKYEEIISYLNNNKNYNVIFVSFYGNYFKTINFDEKLPNNSKLKINFSEMKNVNIFFNGLNNLVEALIDNDRTIILSIDTPQLTFDPRICMRSHIFIGCNEIMRSTNSDSNPILHKKMIYELKKLYPQIIIFDPTPHFCPNEACLVTNENGILYADSTHLSPNGSIYYGSFANKTIEEIFLLRK